MSKEKPHDLIFYSNRSTPQVVTKGSEGKKKKGYGKVTKRRAATADEEKVISTGKWLRVDEKGNKPKDENYKKTKYRPQLVKDVGAKQEGRTNAEKLKMGKTAQQAINNMLKEASKGDILEKTSTLTQELTALDKDLSNLTDAQLNELAKKQQTQIKKMTKPKTPKMPKPPSIPKLAKTADQFRTLFEKDASKAKSIKGFDETLSKLLAMGKKDPKRPELIKAVEEMAPEALAKNPNATPAFMKVRDTILKTGEAESKSQQRLMGMLHAYQNGELDMSELDQELQNKIRSMAKTMTKEDTKDYAETKHKGLPEKKAHFLTKIANRGKIVKGIKSGVDELKDAVQARNLPWRNKSQTSRIRDLSYKNRPNKLKGTDQVKAPETPSIQPASTGSTSTIQRGAGRPKITNQAPIEKVSPKAAPKTKSTTTPKGKNAPPPPKGKDAPTKDKTNKLLAATAVTGLVGAGAIGYSMGNDE